jgi:hypothetical protein
LNTKIKDILPVGPVLFTFSVRAKRLSITIKPDMTVKVTIPEGRSLRLAEEFLKAKIPWITKHLDKLRKPRQDSTKIELPPVNRVRAKIALTARINYLAQKYGFKFNKLFIRNQKTRWGSCSSRNNISLNMNLVSLPRELQDYVILHELVHTRHKNHGKRFWAALNKLVGDSKELRRQMKQYRLRTM